MTPERSMDDFLRDAVLALDKIKLIPAHHWYWFKVDADGRTLAFVGGLN